MMKKLLLLITLTFCLPHFKCRAQIIRSYLFDSPDFIILHKNISKFSTLDTSFLNITYQLSFVEDTTLTDKDKFLNDIMLLQIGRNYSKFFSLKRYHNDSICTKLLERTFQIPLAGSAVQGYEIYHNIKNNKLTVTNRIPFSSKVYEYEEDGGTVKWILQKGKDTILGYICNKATAYFHGRHYTACYTMDIPSHLGPWKFSGLPGLILKINDDKNEYVFECSGISQQPEPIVRYDWKYEKISKKRWMEFEKHIYENAGRYIESTGERVSIYNNGKHEKIPLTWKKNYNPIEKVY